MSTKTKRPDTAAALSDIERRVVAYDGLLDEIDALIEAYRRAKSERNISKADVARALGHKSSSYVSRVLRGRVKNVTASTIALMYYALDHKKEIRPVPLWEEPISNHRHMDDLVQEDWFAVHVDQRPMPRALRSSKVKEHFEAYEDA